MLPAAFKFRCRADLETQITDPHSTYPRETSHFVRWSITHRHAHDLTHPAVAWPGPTTALDTERRWALARRLLHDDTIPHGDTIPVADRVTGFLLLYAQRPAAICRLTTAAYCLYLFHTRRGDLGDAVHWWHQSIALGPRDDGFVPPSAWMHLTVDSCARPSPASRSK